jgi:hypothetical protein
VVTHDANVFTEVGRALWSDVIETLRERDEATPLRRASGTTRERSTSLGERSTSLGERSTSLGERPNFEGERRKTSRFVARSAVAPANS